MTNLNGSGHKELKAYDAPQTRVDTFDTAGGRILCVADIRGNLSALNSLAQQYNAKAIIHTGDFGFYEHSSIERISERTLRHLVQYSPLIDQATRSRLFAPNAPLQQLRTNLLNSPHLLSEFPKLVSGELKLSVPVYTVWGACEDVAVLEKIRAAPISPLSSNSTTPANFNHENPYSITNLAVLSESSTRLLVLGGLRLRLFGLGGAVVYHKLFDNGEGAATIAGGSGTMWTTILQIGELVDTAAKVFDPTETRLLVSHASPGREGLLSQLALVVKADLTISASLHFRYGVSYNEFSVQHEQDNYRNKLATSRSSFNEIFDTVKAQVESVIDEQQKKLLTNALAVVNKVPLASASTTPSIEEPAWKNTWNWNLPDANYGNLVLDISADGRVGAELKSQGFNFAYRQTKQQPLQPTQNTPQAAPAPQASVPKPAVASTPTAQPVPKPSAPQQQNRPTPPAQQPENVNKPAQNQSNDQNGPAPRPPMNGQHQGRGGHSGGRPYNQNRHPSSHQNTSRPNTPKDAPTTNASVPAPMSTPAPPATTTAPPQPSTTEVRENNVSNDDPGWGSSAPKPEEQPRANSPKPPVLSTSEQKSAENTSPSTNLNNNAPNQPPHHNNGNFPNNRGRGGMPRGDYRGRGNRGNFQNRGRGGHRGGPPPGVDRPPSEQRENKADSTNNWRANSTSNAPSANAGPTNAPAPNTSKDNSNGWNSSAPAPQGNQNPSTVSTKDNADKSWGTGDAKTSNNSGW